jgi:hypothetical protein
MQGVLFPALEEQLGPLTGKHRQLAAVFGPTQIEALVACSFVAKGSIPESPFWTPVARDCIARGVDCKAKRASALKKPAFVAGRQMLRITGENPL